MKSGIKYIMAEMRPDTIEPYAPKPIPWVFSGNHPKYTIGTRFDYGYLKTALDEGYTIIIYPMDELDKRIRRR